MEIDYTVISSRLGRVLIGATPLGICAVEMGNSDAALVKALIRRYPRAKIIAIEPEPSNFALLLRNTSSYKNIQSVCAALWREDGEVTLGSSNVHPKGAFQIVENGETRVRAVTLGTVMRETGIQSIDILKVDIEGSEREVFASCNWIDNVHAIVIELHDRVRAGCRRAVETAATDFRSLERGEVTFFLRQRQPSTASTTEYRRAAGGSR